MAADQTVLLAPVDGAITIPTLRVGDQAVENMPLVGPSTLMPGGSSRITRKA
jgi:multidrug resistance efflux pump